MDFRYKCTCGEIIWASELIPEKVFAGNDMEPPEYIWHCPHCEQNEEEMEEYFPDRDDDGEEIEDEL